MKVFISWSGDTSKAIAEILREWIPSVIQSVKPYFSPDDISKGSRWSSDIAQELQECSVGLICLTSENLEAPWIMFEAGALSKSISFAKVCPLLFGIEPSDVKGPLVQFQSASFTKVDIKKTIQMINLSNSEEALEPEVLDNVFEMWWPQLEEKVNRALKDFEKPNRRQVRTDRDILEEILDRVRITSQKGIETSPEIYKALYLDLRNMQSLIWSLHQEINRKETNPEMSDRTLTEIGKQINTLLQFIEYQTGTQIRNFSRSSKYAYIEGVEKTSDKFGDINSED